MKLKILRKYNVGEFVTGSFHAYLKQHGIILQLTVPYRPQLISVAERFTRTLTEMVGYMMFSVNVDDAEAVNKATFLRNRSSKKTVE